MAARFAARLMRCGAAVACVTSCASPPLDKLSPGRQAEVEHITILHDPSAHFSEIGPVKGYACNSAVLDISAARARAVTQTKYQALLLGGNAIAKFSCAVVETTEPCPNCWLCAQCNGAAVTLHLNAG